MATIVERNVKSKTNKPPYCKGHSVSQAPFLVEIHLTHCMLGSFACFYCCLQTFFKINFFKSFFQEHYQSYKQFGSRSGSKVLLGLQGIFCPSIGAEFQPQSQSKIAFFLPMPYMFFQIKKVKNVLLVFGDQVLLLMRNMTHIRMIL